MRIDVPTPAEGEFQTPRGRTDVLKTLLVHLEAIGELAHEAFEAGDPLAWEKAQQLLYRWNLEELERPTPASDAGGYVRRGLRNELVTVEDAVRRRAMAGELAAVDDLSVPQGLELLAEAARAHRVNRHPLLADMARNGLPLHAARLFLENFYVDVRLLHLHIAAQSLAAPFEMRAELARCFHDEMGRGDPRRARAVLFLNSFRTLGKPQAVRPLTEALYLFNAKAFCAWLAGDRAVGLGGMRLVELGEPERMRLIRDGLKKSGVPETDLEYWDARIADGGAHGRGRRRGIEKLVRTPEQVRNALYGGLLLLDAQAGVYDGVWQALSQELAVVGE